MPCEVCGDMVDYAGCKTCERCRDELEDEAAAAEPGRLAAENARLRSQVAALRRACEASEARDGKTVTVEMVSRLRREALAMTAPGAEAKS